MWVTGSRRGRCVLACLGLIGLLAGQARAEDVPIPTVRRLAPPPIPAKIPPKLGFEVHLHAAGPINNDALCPEEADCIFGGGGGVGATVERRKSSGLGWFGGYDAWFLDSASVFELGVQQSLRGGVRYTMPNEALAHPVMEFSLGAMALGDTFRLSTGGVLAQGMVGVELELNEHYALLGGFLLRAFTAFAFRSDRDDVMRGNTGLINQAMAFQFGLSVL